MERLKCLKILGLVIALLCSFEALAFSYRSYSSLFPSKKRSYFLKAGRVFLTDLQVKSGGEATVFAPPTEVELGFRLKKTYSFILINQFTQETEKSDDIELTSYGLGARIDLPGFFLFGAKEKGFTSSRKNYPVNTSISAQMLMLRFEEDGLMKTSVGSKFIFGIDLFLFNSVTYLGFDFGVMNVNGNALGLGGVSLGIQI